MGISSRIRHSAPLHRALTPRGASVLLAAVALLAAALGWLWQDVALTQQRQAFDIVANNIGARIAASMRQNMDLVTTGRAIVETNPSATNDQFVQFVTVQVPPGSQAHPSNNWRSPSSTSYPCFFMVET